jgi:hypothetical protein
MATEIDNVIWEACVDGIINCDLSGASEKIPSRERCDEIKPFYCVTACFPYLPCIPICRASIARQAVCHAANEADEWSAVSDFLVTTESQNLRTVYGENRAARCIFVEDVPHGPGIISNEFPGQPSQFDTLLKAFLDEFNPDVDCDGDVDRDDIFKIIRNRGTAYSVNDPYDVDRDNMVTVLDARRLVPLCTREQCATE